MFWLGTVTVPPVQNLQAKCYLLLHLVHFKTATKHFYWDKHQGTQ